MPRYFIKIWLDGKSFFISDCVPCICNPVDFKITLLRDCKSICKPSTVSVWQITKRWMENIWCEISLNFQTGITNKGVLYSDWIDQICISTNICKIAYKCPRYITFYTKEDCNVIASRIVNLITYTLELWTNNRYVTASVFGGKILFKQLNCAAAIWVKYI